MPRPGPLNILITSPLEREQVERIARFDPERYRVIHEPELLATPRFIADHSGARPVLDATQKARWEALKAEADICFDVDRDDPAGMARLAPRLKWVQCSFAGIGEMLQKSGLDRSGIIFTTAAGTHGRPLAEFVMAGLLDFARDLHWLAEQKAAKAWTPYAAPGLAGSKVLLVGLGGIGRVIAGDLAHFGCEVIGARRSGGAPPEGVSRLVPNNEIITVMPEIDALVIACPLTEETKGLVSRACIEALKPGAVIANIGRGAVIDEEAMIRGLQSGRIKGAALDVFTVEPLPAESPLWEMPNVLISPHAASNDAAENGRIVDLFLDNLGRYARGAPLRNVYEPERGY